MEEQARLARAGDPESVRAFTDAIFDQSILASAAPSIRDRVFRAELAFRDGTQDAIAEERVVDAANAHVGKFNLPEYARFGKGQLHLVRQDLRFYVRSFARSDGHVGAVQSDLMSPAEAVFVVADLMLQKLRNPEYQVGPDRWVAESLARRERAKTLPPGPPVVRTRVATRTLSKENSAILFALQNGLSDEASPAVQGSHAFLDLIGVQR